MPEYLATIWAFAGARLRNAHENAVTTAAVIRMVSSPSEQRAPIYVLPNGRRPVTGLSINQTPRRPQSKRHSACNQSAAQVARHTSKNARRRHRAFFELLKPDDQAD
jgi:hypothetical protein